MNGAMKTRRMKIPRMKIPRIEYSQNTTLKLKTPRNWKLAENEDSQKMKIPRIVIVIWKFPESKDSQNKKILYIWWHPKQGGRGRHPPDCLPGGGVPCRGQGAAAPC